MGERANYVLVEDGHFRLFFRHHFMPRSKWYPKKWELYSSTWRARILDSDLAPGPEAAIRCILDQKRRERQEWYDDIECEGAALIDRSRQVLLFFMYVQDFAHRAALLAVLARTWRAWHVQWAFDGTSDLAAYVGLDRAVVRSGGVMLDLMMVADDDEIDQLVTRSARVGASGWVRVLGGHFRRAGNGGTSAGGCPDGLSISSERDPY